MSDPIQSDLENETSDSRFRVRECLNEMHLLVSNILGLKPPIYIAELVNMNLPDRVKPVSLTEWQWRIIRFALERAEQSISCM
jgi:hypothetical protein